MVTGGNDGSVYGGNDNRGRAGDSGASTGAVRGWMVIGGGLDAIFTPAPSPAPTDVPYVVPEGRAEVICSVMPDCQKALRVALCESGPDYSAPFDGVHVGPFQIAEAYHADKFTAHGWDYYVDGDDPYKNSVIALEILDSAGGVWTGHWPTCGWR